MGVGAEAAGRSASCRARVHHALEAPGGFGKSVLVGQLVDRALARQLPGRPALVCCFLRMGGAHNTTVAFLQAVNAQLLPTSPDAARNAFDRLFKK